MYSHLEILIDKRSQMNEVSPTHFAYISTINLYILFTYNVMRLKEHGIKILSYLRYTKNVRVKIITVHTSCFKRHESLIILQSFYLSRVDITNHFRLEVIASIRI